MRSKNPDVIRALEELDCGVLDGRFEARGTRKVLVMKATADISTAKKINMKLHSRYVNGLLLINSFTVSSNIMNNYV